MKEKIRKYLDILSKSTTMAIIKPLLPKGVKIKSWRTAIAVLREQVTIEAKTKDGHLMPPIELILQEFDNMETMRRLGELGRTDIGTEPKENSVKLLYTVMCKLAYNFTMPEVIESVPDAIMYPDYTKALTKDEERFRKENKPKKGERFNHVSRYNAGKKQYEKLQKEHEMRRL